MEIPNVQQAISKAIPMVETTVLMANSPEVFCRFSGETYLSNNCLDVLKLVF